MRPPLFRRPAHVSSLTPLLFFVLGGMFWFAAVADACSCSPPKPPLEALAESDAVFHGTVLTVEPTPEGRDHAVSFAIHDLWKGDPSVVEVRTPDNSAACGIEFQVGRQYIVYASYFGGPDLATHLCSRTAVFTLAEADSLGEPIWTDGTPKEFRRGDFNADSLFDISDPVSILNFLFLAGDDPVCLDGADVDDNGSVELTDAIALLNHLFLGGEPPVEPFPGCGVDLTPDAVGCTAAHACL